MGELSGKGGTVSYAGTNVARVSSWNVDIDTNMIEVTAFTTSTGTQWREFVDGLSGANGSLDAYWDIGSTASNQQKQMLENVLTPTTAAIALEWDQFNGGKFTGSVYLNRASGSVDVDGSADISYDFTFTGAVTLSTAT